MRLFALDRHYGKHEDELIGELLKIRLHNPAKVGELLKNNDRLVTMYGFSVRVSNCLRQAGIRTVDELAERTEDELRWIRNLGRRRNFGTENRPSTRRPKFQRNR